MLFKFLKSIFSRKEEPSISDVPYKIETPTLEAVQETKKVEVSAHQAEMTTPVEISVPAPAVELPVETKVKKPRRNTRKPRAKKSASAST